MLDVLVGEAGYARASGNPAVERHGGRMSAVPSSAGAAQAAAVSDIPSLDRLLNADALRPALDAHGRTQVVAALRQDLDALRQRALQGGLTRAELDAAAVAGRVDARATAPRLRAVHT